MGLKPQLVAPALGLATLSTLANGQADPEPETLEAAVEVIRALREDLADIQSEQARDESTDSGDSGEQSTETLGFWERLDQSAAESRPAGSPWATMEYQFDTRGFNTLNFTGSSPLPYGFSVWGFIDLMSSDGANDERYDNSTFFYEIDLRRGLTKEFGLIGEVNDAPGIGNHVERFGFFYRPDCELLKDQQAWLYFKVFPYETDGEGGQVSMAWNKRFTGLLGGRFSTGGFIDVNYQSGPSQDDVNIVSDVQFRYRVVEQLSLLAEVRYNEFLRDSGDYGVGFGIQYRF